MSEKLENAAKAMRDVAEAIDQIRETVMQGDSDSLVLRYAIERMFESLVAVVVARLNRIGDVAQIVAAQTEPGEQALTALWLQVEELATERGGMPLKDWKAVAVRNVNVDRLPERLRDGAEFLLQTWANELGIARPAFGESG